MKRNEIKRRPLSDMVQGNLEPESALLHKVVR